jgi:hypothetical protein
VLTNNNSDFSWTGTLTDDVNGPIDGTITLAPNGSQTFTASGTINGTVVNTATATGAFNDPAGTSASTTASATVTGTDCNVSKITPTATTCSQFGGGTAETLSQLNYSVRNGLVSSVNPGVFFYWVKVTATAGSNTFTINQTITTGNFDSHYFNQASGSFVYTNFPSCTKVAIQSITTSGGVTTVTFTAPTAGTYIIGVKYDSKSVVGFAAPSPTTTVHYDFTTAGVSGSTSGVDLVKS